MITHQQRSILRGDLEFRRNQQLLPPYINPDIVLDLLDALDAAEARVAELEQRLSDDAAITAVLKLSAAMEDEEIFSQEHKLDRMGL